MDKKQARRADPFIRYAMVAGKKAIEDAGLGREELEKLDKSRCGVLVGSGMGGMSIFFEGNRTLFDKGFNRITPFFVPFIITNMGGGLLAIDLGFTGPTYSISQQQTIRSFLQHNTLSGEMRILCSAGEVKLQLIQSELLDSL